MDIYLTSPNLDVDLVIQDSVYVSEQSQDHRLERVRGWVRDGRAMLIRQADRTDFVVRFDALGSVIINPGDVAWSSSKPKVWIPMPPTDDALWGWHDAASDA